jgi:hypothetical protein
LNNIINENIILALFLLFDQIPVKMKTRRTIIMPLMERKTAVIAKNEISFDNSTQVSCQAKNESNPNKKQTLWYHLKEN